jgi:hypothetical protein
MDKSMAEAGVNIKINTNQRLGDDLDVYPRVWQTPLHEFAAPERFWHVFGLCGPLPLE